MFPGLEVTQDFLCELDVKFACACHVSGENANDERNLGAGVNLEIQQARGTHGGSLAGSGPLWAVESAAGATPVGATGAR